MPGGQAITSATGILFKDATNDVFVALRSRKIGTGTASGTLLGLVSGLSMGVAAHEEAFSLAGQSLTSAPGTLLYRGQATINWNANPESDLAGYRVWHGIASGVYSEFVDVGNVTTYQWNGLLPGTTHFFVVTAYDTGGLESLPSLEVSKGY